MVQQRIAEAGKSVFNLAFILLVAFPVRRSTSCHRDSSSALAIQRSPAMLKRGEGGADVQSKDVSVWQKRRQLAELGAALALPSSGVAAARPP